MDATNETIEFILTNNVYAEYFLWGAIGAILFNLTLFFNKNLSLTKENQLSFYYSSTNQIFKFIYIICQTVYSAVMGGVIALFANNSLWSAFLVGFFSNIIVAQTVKTVLFNSNKVFFSYIIKNIFVNTLAQPIKNFSKFLDTLTVENEDNDKKNKKNNRSIK